MSFLRIRNESRNSVLIKKVYIQEYGHGKMEPEYLELKTVLEDRGVSSELFTTKRLSRNQLDLKPENFLVGDHEVMRTVFKRLGVQVKVDSYPCSLRPYLKRKVRQIALGKFITESQNGGFYNQFIKPRYDSKSFTGFVVKSNVEYFELSRKSKHLEIYSSEVVNWLTEYRVFIKHSKIIGVKHYAGDKSIKLNLNEVEKAINDFDAAKESTAGYGIDFGVLDTGETALVEFNDGFALGSYGLNKDKYADLILARWTELMFD